MHLLIATMMVVTPALGQATVKRKPAVEAKRIDTPRFDVVREWVRQQCAFHEIDLKVRAEAAADDDKGTDHFPRMIRNSMRNMMELERSIRAIRKMRIHDERFSELLSTYADLLQDRANIYGELKNIGAACVSGTPQAGVDYQKLAARMPELDVLLENSNSALLKLMPAFAYVLIDLRSNHEGKLDRLQITQAERQALVQELETSFEKNLDSPNRTYLVASAKAMLTFLKGNHKCADEP